jgi:predicted chitinase
MGNLWVWWVGVVESRQDPKKMGRCQVRIAGSHTELRSVIPTDDLPWAQPLIPLNDLSSLQIKEGDYVIGFYLDGRDSQVPVIMGILPGIPVALSAATEGFSDPRTAAELSSAPKLPESLSAQSGGVTITEGKAVRYPRRLNEPTTSRLSRNEKISETPIQFKQDSVASSVLAAAGASWSEPKSPYATVYPYNRVLETESGHILEFDDTPGAERIHIYHRSGTFVEYHPDGAQVTRINADAYEIVLSDKNVFIHGDCHITAKNDINLKAGGNINLEASGDVRIKAQGSVKTQAIISQTHFTPGPMNISGLPLNLNLPGAPPPLGAPILPITPPIPVTSSFADVVTPDLTDSGNQALAVRPGANLGDKEPNALSTPTATPENISAPAQTAPTIAITSTEGADEMIRALNRANITNPTQRAAIYAQAQHESDNFKRLTESFKYKREGLLSVWSRYFSESTVDGYIRQDAKIASRVYGNRMGNSTEESQEGWRYRGRGFIQLTGKENYLKVSQDFNQDFVNYPDAAANPETAADIAIWYFTKGRNGRGYHGNYGDVASVTRYVNGGTNGLADRQTKYTASSSNTSVTTFNSALV